MACLSGWWLEAFLPLQGRAAGRQSDTALEDDCGYCSSCDRAPAQDVGEFAEQRSGPVAPAAALVNAATGIWVSDHKFVRGNFGLTATPYRFTRLCVDRYKIYGMGTAAAPDQTLARAASDFQERASGTTSGVRRRQGA
jgi:hypothetical protein